MTRFTTRHRDRFFIIPRDIDLSRLGNYKLLVTYILTACESVQDVPYAFMVKRFLSVIESRPDVKGGKFLQLEDLQESRSKLYDRVAKNLPIGDSKSTPGPLVISLVEVPGASSRQKARRLRRALNRRGLPVQIFCRGWLLYVDLVKPKSLNLRTHLARYDPDVTEENRRSLALCPDRPTSVGHQWWLSIGDGE